MSRPDGSEYVENLVEYFDRLHGKPGFVPELFYDYQKGTDLSIEELADKLAKDAKSYLAAEQVFEPNLDRMKNRLKEYEDQTNTFFVTMQQQGHLPEKYEGKLWEQPLPSSNLEILNADNPLEGYQGEDGHIRYRFHLGFRWKAAFETMVASQKLERALQEQDAQSAAESAAAMVLNACRYGLASELRPGLAWREGQAKGGRRNKARSKGIHETRDQSIRQQFGALMADGRTRATAVSVLAQRHSLSRRHINRILGDDKN